MSPAVPPRRPARRQEAHRNAEQAVTAALPEYLGAPVSKHRSEAPPGHRFRLYFQTWGKNWEYVNDKKYEALKEVVGLAKPHLDLVAAWRERQLELAVADATSVKIFSAKSRSPFVTGMGIEHPLENGFAFLDPYGLPYLPGSSVKGAVRRAAEELALFDSASSAWSLDAVWWLFGFDATSAFYSGTANERNAETDPVRREREAWRQAYEDWAGSAAVDSVRALIEAALPEAEQSRWRGSTVGFLKALAGKDPTLRRSVHLRGSLCFWDVLPKPPGRDLRVDLMNPHYSHYYQTKDKQPPGDWGQPKLIVFLALPERTEFRFVVELRPLSGLPPQLKSQWRNLVAAAIQRTFEWLGFGGKTSQGYGRFEKDEADEKTTEQSAQKERERRAQAEEQRIQEEAKRELESLPPVERAIRELKAAGENRAHEIYRDMNQYAGDDRKRLAGALKEAYQRCGKWTGKLGDKQKEKVKKLKEILGEPS